MKIKEVKYIEGNAVIEIEEYPKHKFCVELKNKNTKQEVVDALKNIIPEKDESEKIFNQLNLKSLEGTEI